MVGQEVLISLLKCYDDVWCESEGVILVGIVLGDLELVRIYSILPTVMDTSAILKIPGQYQLLR